MTGPEHFRAAELLLAEAGAQPGEASAHSIANAQVHATLALAAATALHGVTDHRHWFEAMGTQHTDGSTARGPFAGLPRRPSLAQRAWCSAPCVTALYPGSHQGLGGQYLIPSHLSEEGLQVAILVVAQVPGMTAEEDTALVEALDLEGSPPAGGRIRMAGPTVDGWRIVSLWD